MITIAFYSYKGGCGRTLALANLGVFLAGLGRRVVMLDMDFDAPGLPYKFGISSFTGLSNRKGLVDHIAEAIGKDAALGNIRDCVLPIPYGEGTGHSPTGTQSGELLFIPTGDAGSQKYWASMGTSEWKSFFELKDYSEDQVLFFARILKQQIASLGTEYLLVDARSGVTPYGGAANMLLADRVACFSLLNSMEGIEGTCRVLQGLAEAADVRRTINNVLGKKLEEWKLQPLTALPVLSRVPREALHGEASVQYERLLSTAMAQLSEYGTELQYTSPKFLCNDRVVEVFERIVLSGNDAYETDLAHDYLNLFEALCPEEADGTAAARNERQSITTVAEDWISAIGVSKAPVEMRRMYPVRPLSGRQGVLVNLSDGERNVSFKVVTFCAILEDIHKQILQDTQIPKTEEGASVARREVEEKFRHTGQGAGAEFGKSLLKLWGSHQPTSDEAKICQWCEFDSDVGFGQLVLSEFRVNDSGRIAEGKINIYNHFLAVGRKANDANLCSLMEGYISGVLHAILGLPVTVTHDVHDVDDINRKSNQCIRVDSKRAACEFKFRTT